MNEQKVKLNTGLTIAIYVGAGAAAALLIWKIVEKFSKDDE